MTWKYKKNLLNWHVLLLVSSFLCLSHRFELRGDIWIHQSHTYLFKSSLNRIWNRRPFVRSCKDIRKVLEGVVALTFNVLLVFSSFPSSSSSSVIRYPRFFVYFELRGDVWIHQSHTYLFKSSLNRIWNRRPFVRSCNDIRKVLEGVVALTFNVLLLVFSSFSSSSSSSIRGIVASLFLSLIWIKG